jgi:hypothetical protein
MVLAMPKPKPKLRIGFDADPDPGLPIANPDCPDWERIQKAYGHDLDAELRKRIGQSTYSYLLGVKGEDGALSVEDVRRRIKSISSATATFRRALFESSRPKGLPRHPPGPSQIHADYLINEKLKELGIATVDDGLHELGILLLSLARSCNQVLADLMDPETQGHLQGASWGRWVVALTALLDARGLPIEAGNANQAKQTTSPFVALVRELQKSFAPKYLPRTRKGPRIRSDDTLAKAINTARGEKKPPTSGD